MSIEIKNIENSLIYIPEERPFAGCIHFLHGIIEDIHLYNNMAMFFAKKNYIVILQEYSWMTKSSDHPYNHIGTVDKYEFPQVFSTFKLLQNYVYALPDAGYEISYYPIEFSMSSYLLRNIIGQGMLTRRRSNIILIGSGWQPAIFHRITSRIAYHRCKKYGCNNTDGIMDDILLRHYEKRFPNDLAEYNWLYTDKQMRLIFQETYQNSKVSPYLFIHLANHMDSAERLTHILEGYPITLISGEHDPVTGPLNKVQTKLLKCEDIKVNTITIPDKRHAILTDSGCEDV